MPSSDAVQVQRRYALIAVGYTPDRAGQIVGDKQRTVAQHLHIHRPAEIFAILIQPALGEYFGLVDRAVILERREQAPVRPIGSTRFHDPCWVEKIPPRYFSGNCLPL